jgi:UDP-2-acetamido-2-deoxy-ribo-hexuluronate aminotransferase
MREIRTHGQERRYYHTRIGVGGRMDTLQCAVILAKLETFGWEVEERIRIGLKYREMVASIPGVRAPAVRKDRTCVWAQFTIQSEHRDALVASLKQVGVPTAVHYPLPLHRQPAYKDLCKITGSVAVSEKISSRVLSLPMHAYLDEGTMATISRALREAVTA